MPDWQSEYHVGDMVEVRLDVQGRRRRAWRQAVVVGLGVVDGRPIVDGDRDILVRSRELIRRARP